MIEVDIELRMTPRLGDIGVAKLIEEFGSAERVFRSSAQELKERLNLADDIVKSITSRKMRDAAEREMEYCNRHSITPIAIGNERYPELLAQVDDAPHVIYVMGHIEALRGRMLSIIGTRKMTPYGEKVVMQAVRELAPRVADLTIVSGLAYGVDSAAHRAAMEYNTPTIAVLANPLPDITPVQHTNLARTIIDKGGAIISELNSTTKMNGRYYIPRNRIIAALSAVTLVAESGADGGAMKSADIAFNYSREVLAVPGRVTDSNSFGCNMLIRNQVAKPYLTPEDIIRSAMWDVSQDATPKPSNTIEASALSNEQVGLLNYLNYCQEPPTVNHLLEVTALDMGTLSMLLMELEFAGAVKLISGQRYMPLLSIEK